MEVFRIVKEKRADELSGKGASICGARWNSIGTEVIYTSCNKPLAMAEVLVHLGYGMIPENYSIMTIFIPDNTSICEVEAKDLPTNWDLVPPITLTQQLGDKFVVKAEFCLLKVPSVIVPGEFNILINPLHDEFSKISSKYDPFPFDKRLLKK